MLLKTSFAVLVATAIAVVSASPVPEPLKVSGGSSSHRGSSASKALDKDSKKAGTGHKAISAPFGKIGTVMDHSIAGQQIGSLPIVDKTTVRSPRIHRRANSRAPHVQQPKQHSSANGRSPGHRVHGGEANGHPFNIVNDIPIMNLPIGFVGP
ncbi:hypothetical protein GGI12_003556 [Dipsacomyces acuminosporus]|nr:hypothetical protein GGI12_003556 [Dipsacomyces acuminosporus]